MREKQTIRFGSQGIYEWLVADEDFDLLEVCPEIVLGKFIAITSFDSGVYTPDAHEKAAGWESRGRIGYSPKVVSTGIVPRSHDKVYDEWYVFPHPFELGVSHLEENVFEVPQAPGHVSVFVNYGDFALTRDDSLTGLFWKQMERIGPESYVADGYFLNFASANKRLFASVREAVIALTQE